VNRQAKRRIPPNKRNARFERPRNLSSVTVLKLENFYDFRNWKDVTRYKMRLQDGLLSTGSTRLPTATLIGRERRGPTS
jgi:hypothetical protein